METTTDAETRALSRSEGYILYLRGILHLRENMRKYEGNAVQQMIGHNREYSPGWRGQDGSGRQLIIPPPPPYHAHLLETHPTKVSKKAKMEVAVSLLSKPPPPLLSPISSIILLLTQIPNGRQLIMQPLLPLCMIPNSPTIPNTDQPPWGGQDGCGFEQYQHSIKGALCLTPLRDPRCNKNVLKILNQKPKMETSMSLISEPHSYQWNSSFPFKDFTKPSKVYLLFVGQASIRIKPSFIYVALYWVRSMSE